ncbi:MAG: hypothetical protein QW522_03575 [Candidatus Methanomethyliaceae archaeon]
MIICEKPSKPLIPSTYSSNISITPFAKISFFCSSILIKPIGNTCNEIIHHLKL